MYNLYYKHPTKNLNTKNFLSQLLVLVIIFLSIVTPILFNVKTQEKNKFYFIEIESFSTHKSAENFALNLSKNLPTPYIYFDSKYRVLICFTSSKKQAEKLQKNLQKSNPKASVFSLKFLPIKSSSTLNKNLNKQAKKIVEFLYGLLLKISNKNLSVLPNYEQLKSVAFEIKKCQNEFNIFYNNFLKSKPINSSLNPCVDYLFNIKISLNNLCAIILHQQPLTRFNLQIICIALNLYSFCLNFS